MSRSTVQSEWLKLFEIFVALHLLVYPASHGFNTYYDRDTQSIGGIQSPLPITSDLLWTSLALDLLALLLSLRIGLHFAAFVLVYGMVSKAYSHPKIRLKRHPFLSWGVVSLFQGAWIYFAVQLGAGLSAAQISWRNAGLSSLLIGISYPLTQIYQHGEDASRGDLTLSRLLRIRGTFIFSLIGYVALGIWVAAFLPQTVLGVSFVLLSPVLIYFLSWMRRCFRDPAQANFQNTMRMNQISAISISLFFALLFLHNSSADSLVTERARGFVKETQAPIWFQFERTRVSIDSGSGEETWISKFEDPKDRRISWVEEEVHFKKSLQFVRYHYVQNQTHEEGWIEVKPDSKLEFRFKNSQGERRVERDLPERVAVPPMIESIVIENWKKLLAGETYSFRLAVPDRMDDYGFEIYLFRNQDHSRYVFKLKPTSLFVAAVVNPVFLTYNSHMHVLQASGRCPVLWQNPSGHLEEQEADVHYEN